MVFFYFTEGIDFCLIFKDHYVSALIGFIYISKMHINCNYQNSQIGKSLNDFLSNFIPNKFFFILAKWDGSKICVSANSYHTPKKVISKKNAINILNYNSQFIMKHLFLFLLASKATHIYLESRYKQELDKTERRSLNRGTSQKLE
jgi:DeoR/GlpR family transcriptional regulator of sugar metabolism